MAYKQLHRLSRIGLAPNSIAVSIEVSAIPVLASTNGRSARCSRGVTVFKRPIACDFAHTRIFALNRIQVAELARRGLYGLHQRKAAQDKQADDEPGKGSGDTTASKTAEPLAQVRSPTFRAGAVQPRTFPGRRHRESVAQVGLRELNPMCGRHPAGKGNL